MERPRMPFEPRRSNIPAAFASCQPQHCAIDLIRSAGVVPDALASPGAGNHRPRCRACRKQHLRQHAPRLSMRPRAFRRLGWPCVKPSQSVGLVTLGLGTALRPTDQAPTMTMSAAMSEAGIAWAATDSPLASDMTFFLCCDCLKTSGQLSSCALRTRPAGRSTSR